MNIHNKVRDVVLKSTEYLFHTNTPRDSCQCVFIIKCTSTLISTRDCDMSTGRNVYLHLCNLVLFYTGFITSLFAVGHAELRSDVHHALTRAMLQLLS